jgi:hypothetical protein
MSSQWEALMRDWKKETKVFLPLSASGSHFFLGFGFLGLPPWTCFLLGRLLFFSVVCVFASLEHFTHGLSAFPTSL